MTFVACYARAILRAMHSSDAIDTHLATSFWNRMLPCDNSVKCLKCSGASRMKIAVDTDVAANYLENRAGSADVDYL